MQTTFSILFYPRGNDVDKNGNASLYARITVNSKRSEFSIKRKVLLSRWSAVAGKMRGTTPEVRELNRYIDSVRSRIYKIQEQLSSEEELLTSAKIKNIYLGKTVKHKMVIEIFQSHNDQIEKLEVGS